MSSEFNILLGKKIAEAMAKDALSAAAVVLQTATKVELNKGGPGAPSRPPNPAKTLGQSLQCVLAQNWTTPDG